MSKEDAEPLASQPPTSPSSVFQRPAVRALLVAGAFLMATLIWRMLVECSTGVLLVGLLFLNGASLESVSEGEITDIMSPGLLGAVSAFQLMGMGVIALITARLAGYPLRKSFALEGAPILPWLVAAVSGLFVGFFPGWLVEVLIELAPWLSLGNLEMLSKSLIEASWMSKLVLLIAVCVFAPLFEELVFRGFLWDALDRVMPTWSVWLLTSLLFALYHVDPVHVIGVGFIGLLLGWLRWIGGSIWPAILAHFLNNALATVVTLAFGSEADVSLPWWVALLSLTFTVGLAGVGWLGRKRTE